MINASSKHPLPIPLQVLLLQPCQSGTTCIFILYLVFYRYACTALAFGQTGSGKTHTMTGPPQQVLGIMGYRLAVLCYTCNTINAFRYL